MGWEDAGSLAVRWMLAVCCVLVLSLDYVCEGRSAARHRRQRRDSDTEDAYNLVKSEYTYFYDAFPSFADKLVLKYIHEAPSGLSEVPVLENILSPDDISPTSTCDSSCIVNRFFIVYDVFSEINSSVVDYVIDNYKETFTDTAEKLVVDLDYTRWSLSQFVLAVGGQQTVDVTQTGVGGVNDGVEPLMSSSDYNRLVVLWNALQSL